MARKGDALTQPEPARSRPAPGYLPFPRWLRERYGLPVRKISLNAGLGCPNKDGTIGADGCLFCDRYEAGVDPSRIIGQSVGEQLRRQIDILRYKQSQPCKFMSYLQAGSNTHGPMPRLRRIYEEAISHPEVVSVAISTRPDCLPEETLELIAVVCDHLDVWIELGVQSAHDNTLALIRRRHSFQTVREAVARCQTRGFFVCVHLIVGLPGETKSDLLATAEAVNELKVDAIKLHPLAITRGSGLENEWRENRIRLLTEEEYADLAAAFLRVLAPRIAVQRLAGSGRPEVHLAPDWVRNLDRVRQRIEYLLQAIGEEGTLCPRLPSDSAS